MICHLSFDICNYSLRHTIMAKSSLYEYENKLLDSGIKLIAGVDEVGRGAWAGPLCAAAVVLPKRLRGIDDSKKLSAATRNKLYDRIVSCCDYGIGTVEIGEINRHGLTWANHYAMKRAIDGLSIKPHHLLVDYIKLPKAITELPQTSITDGDALSASIAAASIIAKVARDRLMTQLHRVDADARAFAFHRNFGYGTPHHRRVLMQRGPTKYHRQFYLPVVQSRQGVLFKSDLR